ncbi:MAG: hypothetical protein HPY83_19535 [Anaerolineae bacterium]|nr:hypothetical protein [Anaerolineae bacterium]
MLLVRPSGALFGRPGPVFILSDALEHPVTRRYLEWAFILSGGRLSEGAILAMAAPPRSVADAMFILEPDIRQVLGEMAADFWEQMAACGRRTRRGKPSTTVAAAR